MNLHLPLMMAKLRSISHLSMYQTVFKIKMKWHSNSIRMTTTKMKWPWWNVDFICHMVSPTLWAGSMLGTAFFSWRKWGSGCKLIGESSGQSRCHSSEGKCNHGIEECSMSYTERKIWRQNLSALYAFTWKNIRLQTVICQYYTTISSTA